MSHGRHTFKLTDMTRAIRAAEQAGLRVESAEIDRQTHKLKLIFGQPPDEINVDRNEWDEVLPKPNVAA